MTATEPPLFVMAPRVRRRWLTGYPYVRVEVECEGETHHIRWVRGSLVLEDHDLSRELAMVALGGDVPPCLALRRAWRSALRDEGSTVGRRRLARAAGGWAVPPMPGALAPVLVAALAVSTERRWETDGFREDAGERLGAEMSRLAAEPFSVAVAPMVKALGGTVPVRIECRVAEPGETPSFTGWVDCTGAMASAVLPIRWLTNIVPAGRTLDNDRFVVDLGRRQQAVVDWVRDGDELWAARLVFEPVS